MPCSGLTGGFRSPLSKDLLDELVVHRHREHGGSVLTRPRRLLPVGLAITADQSIHPAPILVPNRDHRVGHLTETNDVFTTESVHPALSADRWSVKAHVSHVSKRKRPPPGVSGADISPLTIS